MESTKLFGNVFSSCDIVIVSNILTVIFLSSIFIYASLFDPILSSYTYSLMLIEFYSILHCSIFLRLFCSILLIILLHHIILYSVCVIPFYYAYFILFYFILFYYNYLVLLSFNFLYISILFDSQQIHRKKNRRKWSINISIYTMFIRTLQDTGTGHLRVPFW